MQIQRLGSTLANGPDTADRMAGHTAYMSGTITQTLQQGVHDLNES